MHKVSFTSAAQWALTVVMIVLGTQAAPAQTIEQITFDEAIRRAMASNPNTAQAAAGILRAEAILQQVRSQSLPTIDATFATTVVGPVTQFAGSSINPRTQTQSGASIAAPLLTPVRWAERAQAADQVVVAQISAADVRRQVAIATAESYLAIIAQRRTFDLNERARENAAAHFEYANQRFQGGLGSRLNMLRAQQELSTDEARVEAALLGIRIAQEALGVLVAADGPVDAAADPAFEVPGDIAVAPLGTEAGLVSNRVDLRLAAARIAAATRVVNDSWKSYLPSVTALFAPQALLPSGLFAQSRSWRASILASVPVFEFGQRRGERREREALLTIAQSERQATARQAISEVRTARESVRLTERALERARAAVDQANEVLTITDVAFREGSTTNIEVIDAQRRARDAETTAATAEDAVRRSRLDLLVAAGRFPQ
jgi:outer membrane protein TolC